VRAREAQTFENIHALPQLHARFERHGVRPTYVVTYPVATDPRAIEILRFLLLRGTCEIGAHHHAWETPPCSPDDVRRHPYASTLPLPQFEAQLEALTDAIARATGERPVTYRSGRFGFAAEHTASLERLGYLVESSVAPLFCEAHKGGPDFVEAPLRPYFLAYDSAVTPGTSNVLEVPCSAALDRDVPRSLARMYARAPFPYQTRRVLRKLGIARVQWIRPSYSTLADMKALGRRLAARGEPVLNMLFHSSEAIVGASPYNRTAAELEAFFDRLERFFEYAVQELGAQPATYREFRHRWIRN
jgi:peptidoglycan/xylan/chitin deacetylase (PgdA/CDA1 family)